MISTLGLRLSAAFRRTAPDPFVIALILTIITFAAVTLGAGLSPGQAVDAWTGPKGLWRTGMLEFAMQMCLILVTGHALASSPPMSAALTWLASRPRSARSGVVLVALTAGTLGILNWGAGLIGGAILARRVGLALHARGVRAHYPLLAAAGYVGMLVWHGGFSGSAPLKVNRAEDIRALFGDPPPFEPLGLDQTILSPLNLFVTLGLLAIAPAVLALLTPSQPSQIETPDRFGVTDRRRDTPPAPIDDDSRKPLLPRVLEDSPLVMLAIVALIAVWAWRYYIPASGPSGLYSLSPNSVNLTMLMVGLVLHGTPGRYMRAVEDAARGCAGIIIQFPLYAGIMGLLEASDLTGQLARAAAAVSNQTTHPLTTLASAGVVNLFVPSGGGQWAVQGPIAIKSALDAGVAPAKTVMALSYGDELTNMLQPFWALPLLAITGVRARDIVGYTAIVMVAAGAWMALGLLLF